MTNPPNKYLGLVLIWASAILLTIFTFQDLLLNANSFIISTGGDGIKNYYTYLYYLQQDHGNHFSGMNYPYGEHVVFTDNMPIIAGSIKWLSQYFPGILNYGLGIMHCLLIASVVICAVYLYRILIHFKVNIWWATTAALFICFFSPQMARMHGHFGMAFSFYIPFVIYQLIRYRGGRRCWYACLIFVSASAMGFVHLYNFAIIALLCVFYLLAYFIIDRKDNVVYRLRFCVPLIIAVALGFLVSKQYLKATDTITDRPDYPYGSLQNNVTGGDLLVADLPLGYIFQFMFGKPAATEGSSYIGIISLLVVLWMIGRTIALLVKKRTQVLRSLQPIPDYDIWLWVALFQLLFAMGVPLFWMRNWVVDYVSVLRQFRAMGRFIWPFYYLISIYAAIYIYHVAVQYLDKNKKVAGYALLSATVVIWLIQLSGPIVQMRTALKRESGNYARLFPDTDQQIGAWLKQKGYDAQSFQAIIGLPFFHIGSEKIWIMDVNEGANFYQLARLSMQSGLPMVNVMMSRTSWSQTFESVNLIDGPFSQKKILNKFDSKPVLLCVNKNDQLKEKEQEWLQYATLIGDLNEHASLYSVDIQAMKQKSMQYRDSIIISANTIAANEGILGNGGYYYANHFDNHNSKVPFAGRGSFMPAYTDKEVVDTIPVPAAYIDSMLNISIWVLANNIDFRTPHFLITQLNEVGEPLETKDIITKYSTNVSNGWYLADRDLKMLSQARKICLQVVADQPQKTYFALDELVVRPLNSVYFYKFNGKLWLNNRPQ